MRRAVNLTSIALLAGLPLVGSACVPQDKYDQLVLAHRTTQEQLNRSEADLDSCQGNLDTALGELDRSRNSYAGLENEYSGLKTMVDDVASENDQYLARISSIEMGPLPPDIETALEGLASAYPEMLAFDARLGMLRFASDFTFDLGSAELTPDARSSVAALAEVLNSSTAMSFEARVVGHTDDVPIRNSGTRAKHPTNLHLSVHRAISVRDTLVGEGVDPVRVQVAGYGEWRPVEANRRGGTPGNRRVEIFLVPLPEAGAMATPQETIIIEEMDEPMK